MSVANLCGTCGELVTIGAQCAICDTWFHTSTKKTCIPAAKQEEVPYFCQQCTDSLQLNPNYKFGDATVTNPSSAAGGGDGGGHGPGLRNRHGRRVSSSTVPAGRGSSASAPLPGQTGAAAGATDSDGGGGQRRLSALRKPSFTMSSSVRRIKPVQNPDAEFGPSSSKSTTPVPSPPLHLDPNSTVGEEGEHPQTQLHPGLSRNNNSIITILNDRGKEQKQPPPLLVRPLGVRFDTEQLDPGATRNGVAPTPSHTGAGTYCGFDPDQRIRDIASQVQKYRKMAKKMKKEDALREEYLELRGDAEDDIDVSIPMSPTGESAYTALLEASMAAAGDMSFNPEDVAAGKGGGHPTSVGGGGNAPYAGTTIFEGKKKVPVSHIEEAQALSEDMVQAIKALSGFDVENGISGELMKVGGDVFAEKNLADRHSRVINEHRSMYHRNAVHHDHFKVDLGDFSNEGLVDSARSTPQELGFTARGGVGGESLQQQRISSSKKKKKVGSSNTKQRGSSSPPLGGYTKDAVPARISIVEEVVP